MQGAIQDILCSRLLFHVHAVNELPHGTSASSYSSSKYSSNRSNDTFLRSQLVLPVEIELTPRRKRDHVDETVSGVVFMCLSFEII